MRARGQWVPVRTVEEAERAYGEAWRALAVEWEHFAAAYGSGSVREIDAARGAFLRATAKADWAHDVLEAAKRLEVRRWP